MSPIDNAPKNPAMSPADMESQSLSYTPAGERWGKNQYQGALRVFAWVTSIISFVVMARNIHGLTTDGLLYFSNNFYDFDVYRYLLAVGVISTVYTKGQVLRQFCNAKPMLTHQGFIYLDFYGDQIIAYLLMSGASAAVQITRDLQNSGDYLNSFTDSCVASISMAYIAFVAMALSAIISAFKLNS